MKMKAVVYVHGKGGSADEAHHYKKFFNDEYDVIGFDYKSELPWEAEMEFRKYFTDISLKYNELILIANSIGAYFSLISLYGSPIKKSDVYFTYSRYGSFDLSYDEKRGYIRRGAQCEKSNHHSLR